MTCIIGAFLDNHAYMVGDTEVTIGDLKVQGGSKVFAYGDDCLVGFAGHDGVIQYLVHERIPIVLEEELGFFPFELAREIRAAPKTEEEWVQAIVMKGKKMYYLNGHGSVTELSAYQYVAIGNGAPYALGYLDGCKEFHTGGMHEAVRCAARWCPGVGSNVSAEYYKI